MAIRPFVKEDILPLKEILLATQVFRNEEIVVAVELMEIVAEEPHQMDYMMFTSVSDDNAVQGYYCVGPTPMTEVSYDLYWMAVDPKRYGSGASRELMEHCETFVRSRSGKKIIAETSSLASYDRTRAFYVKYGFVEEARIKNYYSVGDDLVIFTKQL
jgi:ribosomal protein S18 acetylase RimI-like enzyme